MVEVEEMEAAEEATVEEGAVDCVHVFVRALEWESTSGTVHRVR